MVSFEAITPRESSSPAPTLIAPVEAHAQDPHSSQLNMLEIGPPPEGLTVEEWQDFYHYPWTKEEQEAALAKIIGASPPAPNNISLPPLPLFPLFPQVTIELPSSPPPVPELLPEPPAPVDAIFYQPRLAPPNAPPANNWVQENGTPYTQSPHSLLAELYPGELWDLINGTLVPRKHARGLPPLFPYSELFAMLPSSMTDIANDAHIYEPTTLPGTGEDLDRFLLELDQMDVNVAL